MFCAKIRPPFVETTDLGEMKPPMVLFRTRCRWSADGTNRLTGTVVAGEPVIPGTLVVLAGLVCETIVVVDPLSTFVITAGVRLAPRTIAPHTRGPRSHRGLTNDFRSLGGAQSRLRLMYPAYRVK